MRADARPLPIWRSFLFVPVLNDRFVRGAPSRGADCIQLDLEDAIPVERKEQARVRLPEVADALAAQGCEVIVRINRSWRLALPDMEAAVRRSILALTLPKVPNAEHIQTVVEVVGELERERGLQEGHTGLIAMIETAEGLQRIDAIARADPRLIGIIVGAEDLAVSMGMRPTHKSLMFPNVRAVAAARAAGCLPIGFVGSVVGYSDLEAYRAIVREARELGFVGGFAIHPDQVGILNEEFSPSSDEVEEACAVIESFEKAVREGRGAVSLHGRMVDLPVVERARAVVRAHERILEKERLK